ncbi:hypothetical protein [Candidatus Nitrospira allomarina]|jgi:hypothetical protein|uniref:Uncharacterized protein n=1 Tax=Candidatus Nitrospira allomarina TaxID=3020900 RepID=A0AA96GGZ6_9BACT|nr:hypothetical protein [Candidatus Nitrospira allomarina]WNM57566.1 hypothetical protein PP769_16585 [Candidatus Nitrospira allomarina]
MMIQSLQRKTLTNLVRTGLLLFLLGYGGGSEQAYGDSLNDDLVDLTGGVVPLLSYDPGGSFSGGGELFSGGRLSSRGDVRYLVRLKNQTGDPIEADSLILVVDKIQEMARLRDVTTSLDIQGTDGNTEDGKPYFRVPVDGQAELPPYGESESFPIEIKNPDLLRLYPPVLRVRGIRKTASHAYQGALQNLIQEGVVTPEEAKKSIDQSQ